MLQEITAENKTWDEEINSDQRYRWEKWRLSLHNLEKVKIRRCFTPASFGEVKSVSLHHFSDASNLGYGQCSYLQFQSNEDEIHCSFVMGKSRVSPIKPITIPRLELTAAVVSVKVASMLKKELDLKISEEVYWTDSQVVLGYLANKNKQFHTFVANRIQTVHELSDISQWRYVPSKDNVADLASRGVSASKFSSDSEWLTGPKFLWSKIEKTPQKVFPVSEDDIEVKKVKIKTNATVVEESLLKNLTSRTSNGE